MITLDLPGIAFERNQSQTADSSVPPVSLID